MSPRARSTLVAAALVVAVVGARCKRANGAYCDDARPCPGGFACDLTARECHPMIVVGGGDLAAPIDMAGCNCGGTTPICVAMSCVSCLSTSDPDGACAAVSSSTPFCDTSGSGAGSCIACRSASDCSGVTPFCDAGTHVCRGCVADTECASLICELTPGAQNHGTCIDTGKVVYADVANGADSNSGLSPATATKTLQHAVNVATGLTPARPFVHAAAGSYNENNGVGVNGKSIYIVAATGAILHASGGGHDALGAQGGGSMTVRNLIAMADMGNGGNCTSASFTAYQTQFINSNQLGVVASACTPLILDGCTISGNLQGGITVISGDFKILNSIIVKNNGAGLYQTATAATTAFVNNTVADNSSGVSNVGVTCPPTNGVTLVNTILYDNKGAGGTISETNCNQSFSASDDTGAGTPTVLLSAGHPPGFAAAGDYHLGAGSPCIDQGTSTSAPDHDFDFQPRPDPKTMKVDIGADEVQ